MARAVSATVVLASMKSGWVRLVRWGGVLMPISPPLFGKGRRTTRMLLTSPATTETLWVEPLKIRKAGSSGLVGRVALL